MCSVAVGAKVTDPRFDVRSDPQPIDTNVIRGFLLHERTHHERALHCSVMPGMQHRWKLHAKPLVQGTFS